MATLDLNYILKIGGRMGRDRFQSGRVEEVGKRVKKWKGFFYVYERQADGTEKRKHRSVILGLKAKLRKWEAEKLLADHIERVTKQATGGALQPAKELTLRWFWEQRYRPMKEPTWKESSRKEIIANIERYVIRRIGDIALRDLDKFTLQKHANELAQSYSKSVVDKYLIWTKALLEEAIEQDLIGKNPARKLEPPKVRKVSKRVLTPQEISLIFGFMEPTVRLMLRLSLVLALRPGELLALRWNDVSDSSLRIDEATRYGKLYDPKSEASAASVWLPASVKHDLDWWHSACSDPSNDALIFRSPRGKVCRLDNFRKRVLKPALDAAKRAAIDAGVVMNGVKLEEVTFQACRRSCATYLQKSGNVKDIQAHLRHAQASTTLGVYVQEIPASVRNAVESLDQMLSGRLPVETVTRVLQ
jgi:integrase